MDQPVHEPGPLSGGHGHSLCQGEATRRKGGNDQATIRDDSELITGIKDDVTTVAGLGQPASPCATRQPQALHGLAQVEAFPGLHQEVHLRLL